jgi:hypothetical protein
LGARCGVVADGAVQVIHCLCVTGQDGAHLDVLGFEYVIFTTCIIGVLMEAGDWKSTELRVDAAAWRVSWSLSGNVLAVSTGDNRVSLWKEKLSGGWECVKTIDE